MEVTEDHPRAHAVSYSSIINGAGKHLGAAGCGMSVDKTATNHNEGLTVLSNE